MSIRTIVFSSILLLSHTAWGQMGQLDVVECPPGFKNVKGVLCVERQPTGEKNKRIYYKSNQETKNKTFVDAQLACKRKGGHVCTYAETSIAWNLVSKDIAAGDMLGDYVSDDHHLCVNLPKQEDNFEGLCHKHFKYRYRCCVDLSPLVLMFQNGM